MAKNPGLSELTSLVRLITEGLATIETLDKPFPSLNETGFNPASEAFRRQNPQVTQACKVMASAALQLAAAVMPPVESIFHIVSGGSNIAALRVCLEANVTEILREVGPDGLHVNDIGKKTGVDPDILARVLRILASSHVYRELKPDVFANNRLSGVLDTVKPHNDITARPQNKHDETLGLIAMMEFVVDEGFKAFSYLWESVSSANSEGKEIHAFNHAFNTDKTVWDWYEQPENSYRLKRFGIGMRASTLLQEGDSLILGAMDWANLPQNSVVVDVGGGTGTLSLALATAYPHLKVILQDRQATLTYAEKLWNHKAPRAISSGQVTLQAHDFFTIQPVQAPAAFFLKNIIHDWSDDKSLIILRQLRKVAGSETKLILLDVIVFHACHVPSSVTGSVDYIDGADFPEAPAPLLPNWGTPSTWLTSAGDALMLASLGGKERTLHQFKVLLKQAGWGLKQVKTTFADSQMYALVGIPI